MGVWSRLLDRFNKKQVTSFAYSSGNDIPEWTPKDYEKYAKETYLKNVIAYRCIDEMAKSVASVPWGLFEKTEKGKKKVRIYENDYLELIERPNPEESFAYLMVKWTAFLMMAGNSFLNKICPLTGINKDIPKELYILRPDRMTILKSNGFLNGFEYKVDQRIKKWLLNPITRQSDVLQFKTFNPIDDWWGASVTESVAREIDISNEQTEWNKKLLENEGRPGMIITIEGKLSPKSFENMERNLKTKFGGSENARRTMLLEGAKGTKIEPYGWSPVDLDFIEGGREISRKICNGYNVPPQLVGIPGDNKYCLPAKTLISTDKGPKKIIDINVMDNVYTLSEKGEIVLKRVLNQVCNGTKKIYEIKTKDRTLRATANHPILIRRDKKVKAPMINMRYSEELDYYFEYVAVDKLKIKDVVVELRELPEKLENTYMYYENKQLTIEDMEFLGFYVGNGCIAYKKRIVNGKEERIPSYIHLGVLQSDSHANKYAELGSLFSNRDPVWSSYKRSCNESYYVSFGSRKACDKLIELGFEGNSHTKRVPSWVFELPREYKLSFLRGIVDSDGSIDKQGRVSLFLCNENLIKDIWHLCISCGIHVGNIRKHNYALCPVKSKFVKGTAYIFMISRAEDVQKIGTHNEIYRKRIEQNLGKIYKSCLLASNTRSSIDKIKSLANVKNICYARILSIKELEEEKIYDITVEDNHNFIADGVFVHNSNYSEALLHFYQNPVLFYLNLYKGEVNNWIFPKKSKLYYNYILDDVPALAPLRKTLWDRAQKSNFLTLNEKRTMVGYDERDGFDVALFPSNMIPVDQLLTSTEDIEKEEEKKLQISIQKLIDKGYSEEEAQRYLGVIE